MIRFKAVFILTLAFLFSLKTAGMEKPRFTGYVRNYTGVLASEDAEFAIIQNTADLTIEYNREKVGLKATSWLYHYPGKDLELGLREAYLEMFLGPFDIRIGKQQIIWGNGEGVFITDIISPKDMREFLLPDFEEIRIGVNALKVDFYKGRHNLQLALLPQFVPTRLPERGSIWRQEPTFQVEPEIDSSDTDIPIKLENSEVFGKYSFMSSAIDFAVMAGYMWDDDPTLHIDRGIEPQTGRLSSITVSPRHHRITVAGGDFSSLLGDLVVRGEGALYSGKYFRTADMSDRDGVTEKDYVNYLLGLDYTLLDIYLSTQFIQRVILDYEEDIYEEEFNNMMTFRIQRDFLRDKLTLELFSYVGLNEPDALLRPLAKYELADAFELQFGANIFLGEEGQFGRFDDNDMVYLKTKLSF